MKRSQLILTAILFAILLLAGIAGKLLISRSVAPPAGWSGLLLAGLAGKLQFSYGATPPAGWIGLLLFVLIIGFSLVVADTRRSRRRVIAEMREVALPLEKKPEARRVTQPILDPQGLPYPHPIINVGTCIGCHACVDACPHDVLAII
ncbi:MAG TPA: 4Fe-4S binding protein, partial [Blastocatellia bacterium]|nr:4Fe-4S binding protein [Blastocatellia bacterium]